MRRSLLGLLLLCLAALPARAHFLWLLPPDDGKGAVRLVFSDTLAPDDADLLARVKHAKAFSVGADGKAAAVEFTQKDDALVLGAAGDGPRVFGASCRYGVVQRGDAPPFLLHYYAQTWTGPRPRDVDRILGTVAGRLDLVIVPGQKEAPPAVRVVYKGKPVAGAEVVLRVPGEKQPVTLETDAEGTFRLRRPSGPGLYGIRARMIQKQEGEHDGKKYKEVRHYATLVFAHGPPAKDKPDRETEETDGDGPARKGAKEDPAASKLLADARAARANWENFPGFAAELEVNVDGKVTRGRVDVDAKGKVTLSGITDPAVLRETQRHLSSIVGHRLDNSADLKTPCAFGDVFSQDAEHPLGRAVRVLNDEFHSSYRVRDRQIILVNRTMRDSRFTIAVMENRLNDEKQFLPASYVVNTWDLKTEALKSSQTFHQEWVRVGRYDLPSSVMVVTATGDGKLAARRLKLSDHKLK